MKENPVPESGYHYRMVKRPNGSLEIILIQHKDYKPIKMSAGQLFIVGNDVQGLRNQLKRLNEATMLPVIDYLDIPERPEDFE